LRCVDVNTLVYADTAGNGIPDAFLAAIAIENGATWITADRGFSRFPGLRWQHPLDA
jgi:predicted nucleic acid-binding protein